MFGFLNSYSLRMTPPTTPFQIYSLFNCYCWIYISCWVCSVLFIWLFRVCHLMLNPIRGLSAIRQLADFQAYNIRRVQIIALCLWQICERKMCDPCTCPQNHRKFKLSKILLWANQKPRSWGLYWYQMTRGRTVNIQITELPPHHC